METNVDDSDGARRPWPVTLGTRDDDSSRFWEELDRFSEIDDVEPTTEHTTMASDAPLTFQQTARGITEFIEVAIHMILYVRQIYPVDLFVRRKKYDTPVFQSRHPALNEYISGAIKAVYEELLHGNVEKVVVVVKDKDTPLERFIFAVRNMIEVEGYNVNTSVTGAMSTASLGQYFRSFLVKLSMIESQLGEIDLGDNASFAIVLECTDDKAPMARHGEDPPPWIPSNIQDTTAGASDSAELHLLRAVDTGVINLSLAVQESDEKLRRMQPESEWVPTGKGKEKETTATPTDEPLLDARELSPELSEEIPGLGHAT